MRSLSLKLETWTSLMVQTWSQYSQYFFFKKFMKIVLVLVPSPDCWRERLLGTSTKTGFKGLKELCTKLVFWKVYEISCYSIFILFPFSHTVSIPVAHFWQGFYTKLVCEFLDSRWTTCPPCYIVPAFTVLTTCTDTNVFVQLILFAEI